MKTRPIVVATLVGLSSLLNFSGGSRRSEAQMAPQQIPDDFPRFQVPGREREMDSLRSLFWLHYAGAGPKATMWDEWLPEPSLWPAATTGDSARQMREAWGRELGSRIIDADGYVATHQHPSIAHPLGWPFPFWHQGPGAAGWHFSFKDTVGPPWRPNEPNTPAGWSLQGARDKGVDDEAWNLELTEPNAFVTTPAQDINTFLSPFLQMRWKASGLGEAQPYIEWATAQEPQFGPQRRVYFSSVEGAAPRYPHEGGNGSPIRYSVVAMHRHPRWTGHITQLRVGFGNPRAGGTVGVQALFSMYDTRHNINSQSFISGCTTYFWWTRDLDFLRANINRMRTALRYMMTEGHTLQRKVVLTDWVGHDGRPGIQLEGGKKSLRHGHGIGSNYWDLLPFGHLDCYATLRFYDSLRRMAAVEQEIDAHPEWSVAQGVFRVEPRELLRHAAEIKAEGNRLFWNAATGRFVPGIDADGKFHDYGLTFLNLEAIYYDFATPQHARDIISWISGERVVPGDTAQGKDIYHWRFGPRATTKRNIEYYTFVWSGPETIPWGGQVQDGGAVLGFAYHDLMARLKVRGPDDVWNRLKEIVGWFDEVQTAGGYRKYYDPKRGDKRPGVADATLQGGGTAGGLGFDNEFFESVLVPQIMLRGFLGFEARGDGFRLDPRLPRDWPALTINRIHFQDRVLSVRATRDAIEVRREDGAPQGNLSGQMCRVQLLAGQWRAVPLAADGAAQTTGAASAVKKQPGGAFEIDWSQVAAVRFERTVPPGARR